MSIAVRCLNIVRYDPQAGKYVHCHHEFQVADEWAGRRVRCPQCGQMVSAPEPKASQAHAVAERTKAADANRPAAPGNMESPPSTSPTTEADDYPEVLDDEDEYRLQEPVAPPPSSFPHGEPPRPKSIAAASEAPPSPTAARPPTCEQQAPCPGCGKPLATSAVICGSCGYHQRLQRRVDAFDEEVEQRKVVGFERWLRRQLVEGDDPNAVRSLVALAGVVMIGLGAIAYLILGNLIWILVAAAGVAAAGTWLGWWKLDPWNGLLLVNRMLQWREVTPPFARRRALDLRNMPITDQELANLQNLNEFAVLDLEGAPVTDQGLPVLYDYRNLQFIVLRDTQITE